MQPHRWQPTRLPCLWDSPGKNTGVGCHFLLQCMKVKSESELAQSCLTLRDPMDCSLPGSSVHGISQARVVEWGATAFSVRSLSHAQLFATPWTAARQDSLSFTISWSLFKLMSIESAMPSNHFALCHSLFLLPSIFPSTRVFSHESARRIRWSKYWSFSFTISPPNEYSGLISFRIDWFDLLAVQGTLKSLLQHHSSKASILRCSAFFMVQLSHPYMTTRKTITLTIRTFVGKIMSLLFNSLSRFVIAFLQRSKHLYLILWLQSPSAVILEPKKIKSVTVSIVSPSTYHQVMGLECHDLCFLNVRF